MARLNVVAPAKASGHTKELYAAIQGAVGMVPNILGLGNSPVALEGVLHTDAILKKGQLSGAEIEAVKLAVSEAYAQTVFTNLFNRGTRPCWISRLRLRCNRRPTRAGSSIA